MPIDVDQTAQSWPTLGPPPTERGLGWVGRRAHLVIRVGRRRFAFPAESIHHLLPVVQLLPVPFGPSWLQGLALGHEQLIPALDLGRLMDCPLSSDPGLEQSPALLVKLDSGGEPYPVVFAVDRLIETALIAWNDVHPLRSNNSYHGNPAVLGTWRGYARTCYVLNASALLTNTDWDSLEESLPMLAIAN